MSPEMFGTVLLTLSVWSLVQAALTRMVVNACLEEFKERFESNFRATEVVVPGVSPSSAPSVVAAKPATKEPLDIERSQTPRGAKKELDVSEVEKLQADLMRTY